MMQPQGLQALDQAQRGSSFEALATQARHKSRPFRTRKDEKPILLGHGGHATPLHVVPKMVSVPPQLQKDLPFLALLDFAVRWNKFLP
jgi:hypothetical protein